MRPFTSVIDRLRDAGLRPTRQRLGLAKLLFDGEHRHISAEELHTRARGAGVVVSLATVYNTLHQFTGVGLLKEVVVESGRAYFDTNTTSHHHFYFEKTGQLMDIPHAAIDVGNIPAPPNSAQIRSVEVIIRVE